MSSIAMKRILGGREVPFISAAPKNGRRQKTKGKTVKIARSLNGDISVEDSFEGM